MNWKKVDIYDKDSNYLGTLGQILLKTPKLLETCRLENDTIMDWPNFFLGERNRNRSHGYHSDISWTGFAAVLDSLNITYLKNVSFGDFGGILLRNKKEKELFEKYFPNDRIKPKEYPCLMNFDEGINTYIYKADLEKMLAVMN